MGIFLSRSAPLLVRADTEVVEAPCRGEHRNAGAGNTAPLAAKPAPEIKHSPFPPAEAGGKQRTGSWLNAGLNGAFPMIGLVAILNLFLTIHLPAEDSLPPLVDGKAPQLSLCGSAEALKDNEKIKLGGQAWSELRQFRDIRWVGGKQSAETVQSGHGAMTQQQLDGQIQKAIKESTDQEKSERERK